MRCQYATYADYWVKLDLDVSEITVRCGQKLLAEKLYFVKNEEKLCFDSAETEWALESYDLIARYQVEGETRTVVLSVGDGGVKMTVSEPLQLFGISGFGEDARPMSLKKHDFFRAGYGTACTTIDDMLFELNTDCGLIVEGNCGKRFLFHRESKRYEINALIQEQVLFKLEEKLYENHYKIHYSPINKQASFQKPPVGWMTWYALQFDVNEDRVLQNAKWLYENLNRYGVDTMWIDWEWCHDSGVADNLKPDALRYPNGLNYLTDQIKRYGLVPSLWIGFSTERTENDYMRAHPEILLTDSDPFWCGDYFFDFSHPTYLNEYLPMALKQVDDWGFVGVKFDTLAPGIRAHERNREKMYRPELTTKEVYRNVVSKTREILGKDRYMLSCCAIQDSDILWACELFEAARIGADVFGWQEFVNNAVKRTMRYYPFHNVVFYNDADCVIAREEYSTMEQLKSRAAFVSMLGLPVTLGDDLPGLPEERVEILRRSIPALDAHTMDFDRTEQRDVVLTDLAVDTEVLSYHLVSVFNTTDQAVTETVCLNTLGIDMKVPIAYEYYSGELQEGCSVSAQLKPFETKIYAIREKTEVPQIVSTSRHVTQGIIELKKETWDEAKRMLSLTAELVGQDLYTVSVRVPDSYAFETQNGFDTVVCEGDLLKLSVTVLQNETRSFDVCFR